MLLNLIPSRDPQIYPPFTNKRRDISRGQEDEGDRVVFDKGDVEAGRAAELDIAAGEELEGGLLEAAFCLLSQRRLSRGMGRPYLGAKGWGMKEETYF